MTDLDASGVLARAWRDCLAFTPESIRLRVADVVSNSATELSRTFYDVMLEEPGTGRLLDHELVNRRLHAAMVAWLQRLFDPRAEIEANLEAERITGEVHARIGVPLELVARAARVLQREIARQLTGGRMNRGDLAAALGFVHEMFDLALASMNAAYASSDGRMRRSEDVFRMLLLGQNLKAEREQQRAHLMQWANEILLRHYWEPVGSDSPRSDARFAASSFGLWLKHKATILFEGAPEIEAILDDVRDIEANLLPRLWEARGIPDAARAVVVAINTRIDGVTVLLLSLFDRSMSLENGRDGITQLLNRRYFPAIAKREIGHALRGGLSLAMLVLEIDHFGSVRDTLGLAATDHATGQLADVLSDGVRAGDFVFRIGDGRFCVLLVEATAHAAMSLAEDLRARFETVLVRTPFDAETVVTVSIGVAAFDGHPDYQQLLDRASEALDRAVAGGRNRCVLG